MSNQVVWQFMATAKKSHTDSVQLRPFMVVAFLLNAVTRPIRNGKDVDHFKEFQCLAVVFCLYSIRIHSEREEEYSNSY